MSRAHSKFGNDSSGSSTGSRAIIYTRVSTEEQARYGTSLAAQKAACLEYCGRNGYEVAKIFVEEGESAKSANRTQLKELLAYCRTHKGIAVVVVHKIDRFSRNANDFLTLTTLLATFGVRLRSVTEPVDDSSAGKLLKLVVAGVAEFENNIRTERTVKGMQERLKGGRWTFPPPLGYRPHRDGSGMKTIVPDEQRGSLITLAFEEFSTGLYTKQQVLKKITHLGLRTNNGKFLSAQTFAQTLRKPVYAGRIVVPEWDINVKGKFQALVSLEVFERVQAVLNGRTASIAPRARHTEDFPLRGFVICAECGEPIRGSWSKGRSKHYPYYHCQEGCARVQKMIMEAQFEAYLCQLRPNPDYLRLYKEIVRDVWNVKQHDAQKLQTALSRKLQTLRDNKEKLEDAFVYQRSIDVETYKEMSAKLREEISLVELDLHDAQSEELEIDTILDFAENVLMSASNLWRSAPVEQKQRLQQVLFPERVHYANGVYRTTATCLLFMPIGEKDIAEECLVALPGIEPGFED